MNISIPLVFRPSTHLLEHSTVTNTSHSRIQGHSHSADPHSHSSQAHSKPETECGHDHGEKEKHDVSLSIRILIIELTWLIQIHVCLSYTDSIRTRIPTRLIRATMRSVVVPLGSTRSLLFCLLTSGSLAMNRIMITSQTITPIMVIRTTCKASFSFVLRPPSLCNYYNPSDLPPLSLLVPFSISP